MARKKSQSKKSNVKISVLYRQLAEALEIESMSGKNYRGIQKSLTLLKKKGLVTTRCNAKKEVLILEAKKVLAIREDRKAKFKLMNIPLAS